MLERKNGLWLKVVLLLCVCCTTPALAESANSTQPNPAASVAPIDLVKSYKAGAKAYYKDDDMASAILFLKPAADAGHVLSQALLGHILLQTQDYEDALVYYRKAAEQGNKDGQYGLGMMYAAGYGVKKDKDVAHKLFVIAAENGHKQAVNVLAQSYIEDDTVLLGPKGQEAWSWVKHAANNEYVPAIDALITAYLTGKYGLPADPKAAAVWTAKAKKIREPETKDTKKKSK